MRNTWAAYLVRTSDGSIAWTLGGKASTFSLPANAQFGWQHDVELHPGNQISMFDDACCNITAAGLWAAARPQPRARAVARPRRTHGDRWSSQYTHGATFNAGFLGNTQLLPNGNVVVGWGSKPYFSEFSESRPAPARRGAAGSGRELPRVRLGTGPATPFGAAGRRRSHVWWRDIVYASWDGATIGRRPGGCWPGRTSQHLTTVATRGEIRVRDDDPSGKKYKVFKVQALDAKGHVLGTSRQFGAVSAGGGGGGGGPKVCFYPPC